MANTDIPANKAIGKETEERAKGKGPEGFSGGVDAWPSKQDILQDWDFQEKSSFLWNFLLSNLNAELYSKTLSIEGRNSF